MCPSTNFSRSASPYVEGRGACGASAVCRFLPGTYDVVGEMVKLEVKMNSL